MGVSGVEGLKAWLEGKAEDFDGREYGEDRMVHQLVQFLGFLLLTAFQYQGVIFEIVRPQLILRKRDDISMIKVLKESISAYLFHEGDVMVCDEEDEYKVFGKDTR